MINLETSCEFDQNTLRPLIAVLGQSARSLTMPGE
jgi:hypothetical protein